MYVICKRKFLFEDATVEKNQDGELINNVKETFIISPSPNPQFAPDWIKGTDLYKLAAKDKAIMGVTVDEGDESVPNAPAPPPATGWGAAPQSPITTVPAQGTLNK